MEVTLQYFDGCPNRETTETHLHKLIAEGWDVTVRRERIEDYQTAEQYRRAGMAIDEALRAVDATDRAAELPQLPVLDRPSPTPG